jgi:hypothetical protein
MSDVAIPTNDPHDFDREIETRKKEIARLQAAKRKAARPLPDAEDVWILGSEAIAEKLEELYGKPLGKGATPWTAKKVQQDFARGKFPPNVIWKYGGRTFATTMRMLRQLPVLLVDWEAKRLAERRAERAAKKAGKNS